MKMNEPEFYSGYSETMLKHADVGQPGAGVSGGWQDSLINRIRGMMGITHGDNQAPPKDWGESAQRIGQGLGELVPIGKFGKGFYQGSGLQNLTHDAGEDFGHGTVDGIKGGAGDLLGQGMGFLKDHWKGLAAGGGALLGGGYLLKNLLSSNDDEGDNNKQNPSQGSGYAVNSSKTGKGFAFDKPSVTG